MASAQKLEFNIKMGQSITNSMAEQSDSNMELLSPNRDEEVLMIGAQSAKIKSQERIQTRSGLGNPLNQLNAPDVPTGSNGVASNGSKKGNRPMTGTVAEGGVSNEDLVAMGDLSQLKPQTPIEGQQRQRRIVPKPQVAEEIVKVPMQENDESQFEDAK